MSDIDQKRLQARELKVCPVVIRSGELGAEILMFRHPLAGLQLVKGTVEKSDRDTFIAAKRELKEESGIKQLIALRVLATGNQDSLGKAGILLVA